MGWTTLVIQTLLHCCRVKSWRKLFLSLVSPSFEKNLNFDQIWHRVIKSVDLGDLEIEKDFLPNKNYDFELKNRDTKQGFQL